MNDPEILAIVTEIRNWIRAVSHSSVKTLIEMALPDAKTRRAYQMTDGRTSVEDIRRKCKMSPNDVVALQARCVGLGLMEETPEKRRRRLFNLYDFDLLEALRKK